MGLKSLCISGDAVKFSELVRLLEENGFKIIKEKGAIRYYGKTGHDRLIRLDYHGAKEVPSGPSIPFHIEGRRDQSAVRRNMA
jgi:predicted RNA binding protein YcfA (HicA-like mRNA interferase family)